MSLANINASTLSDYSSLNPLVVAQLWDKTMQEGVIEKEWLSRFQGGEDSQMPIIEKEDLSKGGGQTVNFTVGSELVGDGVRGSNTLIGNEEKENLGTYPVVIDWHRHAVAEDKRFASFKAAERKMKLTDMVSKWVARYKQMQAELRLVKSGAYTSTGIANNLLFAGGGSNDASLTTSNQFDTGSLYLARQKLISLGARPANISKEDGYEVPYFVAIATTDALAGLANDSAWQQASLMARPREGGADAKNPLFTGCYSGKTFNGIIPFEAMLPDHDNPAKGAIGSPLQPRSLLRTATVSLTDTTTINGGGSSGAGTSIYYFRDFPGFDYPFITGATAVSDATTYYAKIIDMPGTANAGQFEIISYVGSTGNNGNALTVTRGVTGGTNTSGVHAANSLIVPCNQSGVAYCHVIIMGAWALLRAYGETRERLQYDKQDYQFINGTAVESVFGQTPAQRTDGKFPNFVIVKVALAI